MEGFVLIYMVRVRISCRLPGGELSVVVVLQSQILYLGGMASLAQGSVPHAQKEPPELY